MPVTPHAVRVLGRTCDRSSRTKLRSDRHASKIISRDRVDEFGRQKPLEAEIDAARLGR
jgi:hypothetical protein